jgi:Na+-translocating ferredoxin:NAD+ oxidoreductase subunit B
MQSERAEPDTAEGSLQRRIMMKDVFIQLRETLDRYGIGFPSVPGADTAYLKKIFTEEEAEAFVAMENRFQPVEELAKRLDRSPDEMKAVLDGMSKKGVVMASKTSPPLYAPLPWLTGWGDFTAYHEDQETAKLELAYKKGFTKSIRGSSYKRNIFRSVPIYESIPDKNSVALQDNVRKIMERADKIAVAKCYCDLHRQKLGKKTTEPLERCFLFGVYADYVSEMGFGRIISSEEAIKILDKCDDAGLVHNALDLSNPIALCNCPSYCGSNITRQFPEMFEIHLNIHNYYAVVDKDLCTGCEECVGRCNIKAISVGSEGTAEVNLKTCVGCGLCVSKCPAEAITLKSKPEHYTPGNRHPNIRSSEEYEADLEPYKDVIKRL